ncbi:MAG: DUF2971 domain-containing protein [Tannerellaceae bacterium]
MKDLECQTYLWYFLMAQYSYSELKDSKEAALLIQKSIDCFENIDYSDDYYCPEVDSKIGLAVAESKYEQIYQSKLYALAGELFATIGKDKESLEAYQKMQYWVNRLKDQHFNGRESIILYSFRSINEYSLADLINKEITVVHPSKMNDPFDSIANLWSTPAALEKRCENTNHISMLSRSFDYYRIRSFVANRASYDTDDSIVKKILMWSHYASEHTGYCIKYNLSRNFIKRSEDEHYIQHYIKPIQYMKDKAVDLKDRSITSDVAYVMKNAVWEYEDEVRLVSYNPEVESPFLGIPLDEKSSIEAIYLGYNCSSENEKLIKNILNRQLKEANASLFRMTIDDTKNVYDLIPSPIDYK